MGNQTTTLSMAGVMDVDTFGKLKATLNVVQPSRQLAQRYSFWDFQGASSLCGGPTSQHGPAQEGVQLHQPRAAARGTEPEPGRAGEQRFSRGGPPRVGPRCPRRKRRKGGQRSGRGPPLLWAGRAPGTTPGLVSTSNTRVAAHYHASPLRDQGEPFRWGITSGQQGRLQTFPVTVLSSLGPLDAGRRAQPSGAAFLPAGG